MWGRRWSGSRRGGVLLLHGGQNRNWDMLPETWEWFPGSDAWPMVPDASPLNPGARTSHAMVWDSARERTILFGGTDLHRDFADTWAFDGSTSRWERLDTSGNPPPRSQHGMIYDPVTDQVILFGGRGMNQERLHDTWLLDLATLEWIQPASTRAAPHPRGRDHVQMARDSLTGIIVMRGSSLGPGLPDETWHFDAHARSWSLAQTNQEPQEMGHGFLRSVERMGGLVLFGFHGSWETSGGYLPLWFNTITYPGRVVGYEFYGQCKSSGMSHQVARYASMASGTLAMCFVGAILGVCTYGVVQPLSKRL